MQKFTLFTVTFEKTHLERSKLTNHTFGMKNLHSTNHSIQK